MSKRNFTRTPRRSALALAIGLGFAGMAFGQATTGGIYGQVPAGSGESVLIKSSSGVTRTAPVDASGNYAVNQLPLGTYTVSLQHDGQVVDSRSNVSLRVGASTEVSFAGANAANAKELGGLTVTANALPSIDVTSVDSRTVITAQQLRTLPLARNAEAIALLAPGAVGGTTAFAALTGPTGNQLVSFGGAGVSENAYYINGMNVTDPLNGLGGIDLPYGSIDQEEVLTGGYGAAYGRSDGGVINQIGKRGTNEWHFGGQILWTPEALRSDPNSIYLSAANPHAGDLYQYRGANKGWTAVESAYVGGPLIKDKLYMFASAEATRTNDTYVSPASAGIANERQYRDPSWYAKLDWNINESNILELTGAQTEHSYNANVYNYDSDTHTEGDFISGDTHTKTSARMWIAKYTGYITDNLTVTAQYGKQKTELYSELSSSFDPNLLYIYGPDQQNPDLGGGGGGIANTQAVDTTNDPAHEDKGSNYRFDVSYVLGNHTITAGIDNQRTQDLNDGQYIPTNGNYSWEYGTTPDATQQIADGFVDPAAGYPGGTRPGDPKGYYVDQYRYRTAASVMVQQKAQYIEDSWQVSDRWLLKLGLRNDQFTNYNSDGDAYLRQTKPQWAPRLGASWDVNGDSSFRIYANAGRYYLALPTSVALRGASGSLYTRVYYTYTGIDPQTGYPTGLTPVNTVKGPGAEISENNEYGQAPDPHTVTAKSLTAQYQDEYILGFDKQFNAAWTYGAKFTYRDLKNAIDDTCNFELFFAKADAEGLDTNSLRGCYFFNPGRAATFQLPDGNGGYGQLSFSNDELGYEHAKRSYYALNLYLDHPFDGTWYGRVDYTFSRNYGNTEGQVKSDIGQADIAATQDWDYPSLMEFANGRLSNDRTHQLKIYGGYQITPEWNLSGILMVASGAPSSCLGAYGPDQTYPAYAGPYYHWCGGAPAPAGSAGDTPWTHTLSLNAEYRPNFAANKLAFNVNVYNVFNEQNATHLYPYQTASYGRVQSFETPRYVRFGVTYDF
jgi:outer membrane receptor for ferrienterochelin and colicin